MTTANKITIVRVAFIPLFMVAMLAGIPYSNWISLGIFILASLTDWVDGYIARKYDQVTSFGKFMDPLADKLLVTSAILIFVQWGRIPAWAAMIVITREFAVTGLRLVAAADGEVIAAGMSGKIKTFVSMAGLCVMLTPFHDLELIAGRFNLDNLIVLLILIPTVWSGVEYFVKNYKVILNSK